jgi:hypothetical protein
MPDDTAVLDAPSAPAADGAPPPTSSASVTPPAGESSASVPNAAKDAPAGAEPAAPITEYGAADLTAPEGSTLAPTDVERIAATARAQGLSKTQAQGLVEMLHQHEAARTATIAGEVTRWKDAALADPELAGGNPATLEKNLTRAKQAALRYGGAEAMQALETSGLGNHPVLLKLLLNVANASAEGTLSLPSATSGAAPRTVAEVFYGRKTAVPEPDEAA